MEIERIKALLDEGRPCKELFYRYSYWFEFDGETELIPPSEMVKAVKGRGKKS